MRSLLTWMSAEKFEVAREARGPGRRWFVWTMVLCLLALNAGPGWAVSGVSVMLSPATLSVAPGSDFYLDLEVTEPSDAYSGWEGTLVFDSNALTLVNNEEGCLMTGSCSNSCGSTFLRVTPGPDSVYVVDALICYQTFITAPGQLFHLHFRASNTPQQTSISLQKVRFSDGLHYLSPIVYSGAQIGIGQPVTAVEPGSPTTGLRLSATPNPARHAVTLAIDAADSGVQELAVHDLMGRTVRVLSSGWQASGSRQVAWDGNDVSGLRVPPGVYLVTLRGGSSLVRTRVTLLE